MPDKGSAERVTGTFNEQGFSSKAVDMSIPCSWVSTLLSSWPGARATGQGPMASNGRVADRLMSPHTRHQTERFSPRGQRAPTQEPSSPFPFLSRYPLFMLGSAVDVWRLRGIFVSRPWITSVCLSLLVLVVYPSTLRVGAPGASRAGPLGRVARDRIFILASQSSAGVLIFAPTISSV